MNKLKFDIFDSSEDHPLFKLIKNNQELDICLCQLVSFVTEQIDSKRVDILEYEE